MEESSSHHHLELNMTTVTDTRESQVVLMLGTGLSLDEVSATTGYSREKIRQIGNRLGTPPKVSDDWIAPAMHAFAVQVSEEICAHLDRGVVLTIPELRDLFPGVTPRYLRGAVSVAQCTGLLGVASPPEKMAFTNEEILDALRDAWAALGEEAVEMTGTTYDRLLHGGDIDGPSRVLIIQRFGSWAEACQQAGIPFRAARRHYEGYTDEDLMEWIYAYALMAIRSNESITFAGYSAWAKANEAGAPSGSLIKARLSARTQPWNEIRDGAILHCYGMLRDFFARAERMAE
jgi:hypothetical protein